MVLAVPASGLYSIRNSFALSNAMDVFPPSSLRTPSDDRSIRMDSAICRGRNEETSCPLSARVNVYFDVLSSAAVMDRMAVYGMLSTVGHSEIRDRMESP